MSDKVDFLLEYTHLQFLQDKQLKLLQRTYGVAYNGRQKPQGFHLIRNYLFSPQVPNLDKVQFLICPSPLIHSNKQVLKSQ